MIESSLDESRDSVQRRSLESAADRPSESSQKLPPRLSQTQSSLSRIAIDGLTRSPRTPNRVRFAVEDREASETTLNENCRSPSPPSPEVEDCAGNDGYIPYGRSDSGVSNTSQRVPLLVGIETPGLEDSTTDVPEDARPKSGMRSAFMNMANSIM